MSTCDNQPDPKFVIDNGSKSYVPPDLCVGTINYSTGECADNDSNYMAALQAEALQAAGGPVNVFLMLGVHSQGSTVDQVNANGYPLSSGQSGGYNALDAFNVNSNTWQSIQTGAAVVTTPAYIGYSFGTKKAWEAIGPAQERYFPTEPVRKLLGTIKIKQSADPLKRATMLRVEACDDGVSWKRIDVIKVPNSGSLVSIGVKSAAAYNMYRFIPVFFNGVGANLPWEVEQIQLLEATTTSIDNVQDFFLLENRDRAYSREAIMLKCSYDLLDVQTELAKFGIELPQTYIFTASFPILVKALGRPLVIGDVLELPGEVEYDAHLRPVRKWLEVTDTAWGTDGYTPNWKSQLYRFYAQPIMPSQEHRDLLGVPGQVNDKQSDEDLINLGELLNNQAYKATEAIVQEMQDLVPQTGADGSNVQSGKSVIGPNGSYDGTDYSVQDALPPDGSAFTVGDVLPAGNTISEGHFHRQTYTMLAASMRPPDRLLRWNGSMWRVVEVNTKVTAESHKRSAAKVLQSSTKRDLNQKL